MKILHNSLLVNAAGQLMQQHAFDHLSDDKLSRMNNCMRQLLHDDISIKERKEKEEELLNFCLEADLYDESVTMQSLHKWQTAISYYGLSAEPVVLMREEL
jgi:hypothetical protein